jgi:hypothetical protein
MNIDKTDYMFEFFPKDGKTIDFNGMVNSVYLGPLIKSMVFCMQDAKYHEIKRGSCVHNYV